MDRATSLRYDLGTDTLDTVERMPSYREGCYSIANASAEDKMTAYMEFIKEATEASDSTKRKIRKVLGIGEFRRLSL